MANKWTVLTESETSVTVASGSLTSDLPVFGAGGATVKGGTKTGNTDAVVTATGAPTANRPLLFDANGNAVARQPRGNTTVVQLADSITNPTSGNVAGFDANGNVKDSGLAAALLLVNPMTTKGDLIGYGTGVARLGAGTNGQVMTANSGAANGVDWEALPTATSSALGLVKPDNSSITISGGVISAAGGGGAGSSVSAGTFSGLPGSPSNGQLYLFTDSIYDQALYQSSAWSYMKNGRIMTPPADSSFTWHNQSTATVTTASGGANILSAIGANAVNVNGRYIAYPAAPFTITMAARIKGFPQSAKPAGNTNGGMYLSDGTKVVTFCIYNLAQPGFNVQYGPSMTNITTNVAVDEPVSPMDIYWLRFDDSVTTSGKRSYYISYDGTVWILMYQESNSTNLTATRIGYYAYAYDSNTYTQTWVCHWLKS